jgi:CRISPR-associated protein Csm2
MTPANRPLPKDRRDPKALSSPASREDRAQSKNKSFDAKVEDARQVAKDIEKRIDELKGGFSSYETRKLVEDSQKLGEALADVGLKTNQIRKFLDAVKRLKTQQRLDSKKENKASSGSSESAQNEASVKKRSLTNEVSSNLPLLLPQIAYAAAKQRKFNKKVGEFGPVDPLELVLKTAIRRVETADDLARLSQFIESIVAYHKAAGGKDQ